MQATVDLTENQKLLIGIQDDFTGGMNLYRDDSKLAANEYAEAFNVRNRTGGLTPTTLPVVLSTAPAGLKQGIYGFDIFFVLFVAGNAYYQIAGTTTWIQIVGFSMSATAPVIYAQAVPASTVNYSRSLVSDTNFQGTELNTNITLSNININGTPAALLCQDGINQPWVIFPDKSSRVTQTYSQWALVPSATAPVSLGREYVPIGKQMAYCNGILFIASADGTQLFRSVSGRPLDFGVNIDINGNIAGDATTVSYAVSYNPITCLYAMNNGQLLVGTTFGVFPITINYALLIFGEPTFQNLTPLNTEILNQFGVVDILGDYALVGFSGIISFNAVASIQNEARNAPFSIKVRPMFQNNAQNPQQVCAVVFDNYALFSVKTPYGYGILVYDTINTCWVSFDPTPEPIIGMAVTNIQTTPTIYGISTDNVYELYSPTAENATPFVHLSSILSGTLKKELKTTNMRAVFYQSDYAGTASVTEVMNGKKQGKTIKQALPEDTGPLVYSCNYPLYWNAVDRCSLLVFNFAGLCSQGYKLGAYLTWSNNSQLLQFQIEAEQIATQSSLKQKDQAYASSN